jgi:hypothetical protein
MGPCPRGRKTLGRRGTVYARPMLRAPSRCRLGALASCLGALTLSGCLPSIRSVFIDISYPKESPALAPRMEALGIDAATVATLSGDYSAPREVSACLTELARDPEVAGATWSFAQCELRGGTLERCLAAEPWMKPGTGGAPFSIEHRCSRPPSRPDDRLALALALNAQGEATLARHIAAYGPDAATQPMGVATRSAMQLTQTHAAQLLAHDAAPLRRPGEPSLALSGGAANGAYVAGWVNALLWLRESARRRAAPSERSAIDAERFGSTFGASVGSLIGLPTDLYFNERAPTPRERQALEACVKISDAKLPPDPARLTQECAIEKLERDFDVNEWDLLCAQPGSVLRLASPEVSSLLRFDPLQHGVLEPYFRDLGSLAATSSVVRGAMTVDFAQSLLVGLDERACLAPGMDRERCETLGVIASISQPLFAPPQPRVWSGFAGEGGESGAWLDGGVRSSNPAARAALFTRGKVLAVNTFRALGLPVKEVKGLSNVALGMIGTLGVQLVEWEVGTAEGVIARRREQACRVGALTGVTALCPPPAPVGAGLATDLLNVWVPDDIAPKVLAAAGYTFDPVVMRGLYLWGQRAFFRSRSTVLGFLDWCHVATAERSIQGCPTTPVAPGLAAAVATRIAAVDAELAGYAKYDDPRVWEQHLDERRKLMNEHFEACD